MVLFHSSIHYSVSVAPPWRSQIRRLRNNVMHFVFTSSKPSPSYCGSKYRIDNGTRKMFPHHMNQAVALYVRQLFVYYSEDLCLVPQLLKLKDVDVTYALQKFRSRRNAEHSECRVCVTMEDHVQGVVSANVT